VGSHSLKISIVDQSQSSVTNNFEIKVTVTSLKSEEETPEELENEDDQNAGPGEPADETTTT